MSTDDGGTCSSTLEGSGFAIVPNVLSESAIARLAGAIDERLEQVDCRVKRGDVVLMRSLLLHASAIATNPARRRVVHIEYAFRDLPRGLSWHERVGPTNPEEL